MGKLVKGYEARAQIDIGKIKNLIEEKKKVFKSTEWKTDDEMIIAASEIIIMEEALKETLEIHKFIMENLGD